MRLNRLSQPLLAIILNTYLYDVAVHDINHWRKDNVTITLAEQLLYETDDEEN